jgi:hypothetical protein
VDAAGVQAPHHCSLRFPPGWFGAHRAEVEAAGFVSPSGRRRSLTRDRPRRCRRNLGTGTHRRTKLNVRSPALPGIARHWRMIGKIFCYREDFALV